MNPRWQDLDWGAPWFSPLADVGRSVGNQISHGSSVSHALNSMGRTYPRFVPQAELPAGTAYEQHIFDTGCVPTREGLHDFFNGLCWMRFPHTKQGLNRLQAGEIAKAGGVGQVRGPVRDALTLMDENAALLQAPDVLWAALLRRDWRCLFGELRPLWAQARLVLLGHALMEKLVQPYKSITAHVCRTPVPLGLGSDLAAWDAWLAEGLSPEVLACKPFTPLPVLGVPGWWPANENPVFYDDTSVFRAPRLPV